jgi:molybdopterin converting factor small subunit
VLCQQVRIAENAIGTLSRGTAVERIALVKLRYFAWVRERIGKPEEEIDPPAGVATIGELMTWLSQRGEEYAHAFALTPISVSSYRKQKSALSNWRRGDERKVPTSQRRLTEWSTPFPLHGGYLNGSTTSLHGQ